MLHGIFLHRAFVDLESPSAGLVCDRDHTHDIVSVLYQSVEGCDGEFRRTHEYYPGLSQPAHYSVPDFLDDCADFIHIQY